MSRSMLLSGGRCARVWAAPSVTRLNDPCRTQVSDGDARYLEYLRRLEVPSDIRRHLSFLYKTVLDYRAPVVIELGVRTGNSTSALLAGVVAAAGELWSVDVACPAVPKAWFDDSRWHFLRADDLSDHARTRLPGAADVLFIDTSHAYEHTLEELRVYVPRVRRGGVVALHDTQLTPDGIDAGKPTGCVARALDTYCAETGRYWENRPGSYGLGVIQI